MLNWDDMKYFLAIAEEGSLSAAARKLKVSQPTLSRRLATLEENSAADLFARNRNGLELTALGEELIEHARHMRDDVHAAERLITGHDSSLKGTVVISCIEIIGVEWLLKISKKLRQAYPGISIEIKIDNEATDLLRREADIALRMFRPQQNDLIAKKTVTLNYSYYASQDYIAKHGKPEVLTDLKHHENIMPDEIIMARTSKGRVASGRPTLTPAIRSNSLVALSAAVQKGLGIGACSWFVAHDDPNLVRLFGDFIVFSADIWLVCHSDLKRSARIRAVYDFIADELQKDKHKFSGT